MRSRLYREVMLTLCVVTGVCVLAAGVFAATRDDNQPTSTEIAPHHKVWTRVVLVKIDGHDYACVLSEDTINSSTYKAAGIALAQSCDFLNARD